ncbi:hypothetical protein B0H13DRAFT_1853346 [Mycena leptocephala]|nr:hypothetical protein B0H13DRAFT_1853346 [Mycena leptocephala]
MAEDAGDDVNMPPDVMMLLLVLHLERFFVGPKSYNPPVRGWSDELILENHRNDVVEAVNANPAKCLAAVIIASDFQDRARGPGAIKNIFTLRGITDTDKIDIAPPTPENPVPAFLGIPWTNIIFDCTAALRPRPQNPWIIAVYIGLSALTTEAEFKSAFRSSLLADLAITQLIRDDHSNVPGEFGTAFILDVILHFPEFHVGSVKVRGIRNMVPTIAHRILFPPISTVLATSKRLQKLIMARTFTFNVTRRGDAVPWLGSNPNKLATMSCPLCHGVDHYDEDCAIVKSPGFRAAHGIVDDQAGPSSVPTSLTIEPVASTSNDSNDANSGYRGGFRGRGYLGGRGGGNFRGGPRGGGRGYHGSAPY